MASYPLRRRENALCATITDFAMTRHRGSKDRVSFTRELAAIAQDAYRHATQRAIVSMPFDCPYLVLESIGAGVRSAFEGEYCRQLTRSSGDRGINGLGRRMHAQHGNLVRRAVQSQLAPGAHAAITRRDG
jgi:spore coat polysaccharide biosynthesis protein SpsF (cytidylyltransferase family)